jgi:hypothetical protein
MPATRVQTPAGEVHIPRPPNAFLCFRTQFLKEHKATLTRSAAGKVGQMDMSRLAGSRWNEMTPAERKPYVEMALRLKAEHAVTYPNYRLKMGPRARASKGAPTHAASASSAAPDSRWGSVPPVAQSHASSHHRIPTRSSPRVPAAARDARHASYIPPPAEVGYSNGKGKNKVFQALRIRTACISLTYLQQTMEYTRSNRPSSWDRGPPQFGTRQPGSSRNYCPDYMLEYPTQGHTNAYLDLQQQPEFGFFCPWDHDFSQPPPQFDTTWTPEYPTF